MNSQNILASYVSYYSNPHLKDKGTAELRQKNYLGVTAEPLDVCLAHDILTRDEHRSGIYFRQLFMFLFGCPTLPCYNPALKGKAIDTTDISQVETCTSLYKDITHILKKTKALRITMDICIYHIVPRFLGKYYAQSVYHSVPSGYSIEKERDGFKEGMMALKDFFVRMVVKKMAVGG